MVCLYILVTFFKSLCLHLSLSSLLLSLFTEGISHYFSGIFGHSRYRRIPIITELSKLCFKDKLQGRYLCDPKLIFLKSSQRTEEAEWGPKASLDITQLVTLSSRAYYIWVSGGRNTICLLHSSRYQDKELSSWLSLIQRDSPMGGDVDFEGC